MKFRAWAGLAPMLIAGAWVSPVSADASSVAAPDAVTEWNAITVNCVQGGTTPANRLGPAGLLDIALVQAAVHDAVQAIEGRYESYHYENPSLQGMGSSSAAASAAAFDMLKSLYGADDACLSNVADPNVVYAGDQGLQAGAEAAAALKSLHRPTVVLPTDPFHGSNEPGQWRATTPGVGTFLAITAPFAMESSNQFRPAAPPRLKSLRYWLEYLEVKALGSKDSAIRNDAQTEAARFWTVNFFSQWNQAVRHLAEQRVPETGDRARLFALVAMAMADSQISVYDAKYRYNYWRPVTAIQEGDFDGNPLTRGDAGWTPFVTTPSYPEYSSGANCLAAAITGVLRGYFGTDKVSMSIWSSGVGVTKNPRTYTRLSEIEREMVEVRIWQGIHFRTAENVGREQGARIGRWTYENYLKPIKVTK